MFEIKKLRADHVIDFAAEELKKYLRMMMPQAGDAVISYDPAATTGFRLGLLEDFGIKSEAEDPVLDDIVHIEADKNGGILAGSNPRSVLFAVYRFFKENGARWLYPGIDGEYIPIKEIEAVKYHKMADHRFRGQCNEGAESQQCMVETIDFYAKLEMNVYMIEFDIPYYYYSVYYNHKHNEKNRPPEPVSFEQVLQWKRVCEVEIAKRGLQFHDMGHGWTAEPFGISSTEGWKPSSVQELTEEQRECLAEVNGVRELWGGVALNTNLCMSSPKVKEIMAKGVADYAESHSNVDFIHVWLADGTYNHCECAECRKMIPSDHYIGMMNEIDAELTARKLKSRIVFIAYVDTLWGPEHITIKNPERFSLLYAPITRSYTSSLTKESKIPEIPAFKLNKWEYPISAEENIAFLKDWKRTWRGPCFSYEYHFHVHLYTDPGQMAISRRIYEDIMALKDYELDGYVEDGSQRCFFPNGFALYIFAAALLDRNCDYDAVMEDYFRHCYGEEWKAVADYLQAISDTFDFAFMEGEKSTDKDYGKYYNAENAKKLLGIPALTAKARAIAEAHLNMPSRPQTVSMRLLLRHAEYCEGVAAFMHEKALGNAEKAREIGYKFFDDFGRHEFEIERYFDHGLAMISLNKIIRKPSKTMNKMGEN